VVMDWAAMCLSSLWTWDLELHLGSVYLHWRVNRSNSGHSMRKAAERSLEGHSSSQLYQVGVSIEFVKMHL
jgi:hypothetical protein